ncbi:hypothetical protein [Nocardiopsis sp. LOL_012]|uniref:hypothetical protein n=1 Tax=Nocardiopsis sp. LOL_012 TaxID=3345409 RepID=UPI003A838998
MTSTAATSRRLRALRRQVLDRAEHELAPADAALLADMLDLHGRDDTKPCTGPCGRDKPVTAFGLDRGYRRGRCRECEAAAKRRPGTPPRAQRPISPCGTPAAAFRHYRAGEKPCRPCAQALADKERARARARREQRRAPAV